VCCCSCLLQLVYLWGISPSPLLSTWGAPPHLLLFLLLLLLLIIQFFFLFSLGGVSVCPGGYADLAQVCLWEYRVPLSSPCSLHLPKLSGHWRL
jgi:hypothetical protein